MSGSGTVYSDLKVFAHPDRIQGLLENRRVAPIYVRIKPTNICNQSCKYCCYAQGMRVDDRVVNHCESIPWHILESAVDDMGDMGVKAVTFSGGGDPLCYEHIVDAVNKVKSRNIDYSIITNGQLLCGKKAECLYDAKWIRISLDAATEETYRAIRSVDTFDGIVDNLKSFVNEKSKQCTVGINCVISKDNYQEIYEICKLCYEIGCNNIKLTPIRISENEIGYHDEIKGNVERQIGQAKEDFENSNFTIIDKYKQEVQVLGDYQKIYHRCYIQELFTVIGADCKLYRCHQRAYTKTGEIGDLRKNKFKDIWMSEETRLLTLEYDPTIECKMGGCVFETRNEVLMSFMNLDINHINFI